jgi:hypothetical protein
LDCSKDPFDKDKDMEAELILDDEDFPINPRITYHKRLRGRMELCSFLAGVWKRHALLSMDGLQKKKHPWHR